MAAAQAQRSLKMVAAASALGGKGNGAGGPASLGGVGGSFTLTSQGVERGQAARRERHPPVCCLGGAGLPRLGLAAASRGKEREK